MALTPLQCLTVFPEQIHALGLRPLQIVEEPRRASPSGPGRHGASRLTAPEKCEVYFGLRFHHGLEPLDKSEPMMLGTLIHTRLAFYYQAKIPGPPPSWFNQDVEEAVAHDARGNGAWIEQSRMIFDAFLDEQNRCPVWKPLYVEHEFTASIKELDPHYREDPDDPDDRKMPGEDELEVTAKVDLLVEENDGSDWVVDHKSKFLMWNSEQLPQWNEDEFTLSWQVLLYLTVVRLHHQRLVRQQQQQAAAGVGNLPFKSPKGFIIQRISRRLPLDHDQHKVRIAPEPYSQVGRVARLKARKELKLMKRIEMGKPLIPNYASCGGGGWDTGQYTCDFHALCSAGKAERQGIFQNLYFRAA